MMSVQIVAEMEAEMERLGVLFSDALMPVIDSLSDDLHLLWLMRLSWPERWWHLVSGHRRAGSCIGHPWRRNG